MTTFKIHPAIGIARLGNSDQFYLAPEQPGALPIECDEQGLETVDDQGRPVHVSSFKEDGDLSKVKRQAARFRVFAYEGENRTGRQAADGRKTFDCLLARPGSGLRVGRGRRAGARIDQPPRRGGGFLHYQPGRRRP
ncbi:MAG: LodA/GoxA family CTQ-dependent oxidase [Xanthomonadaceae bacterium]|nr:LodA/GoxA family CTQ-dependent oxidase [Xanthomonadaceae bacterium]